MESLIYTLEKESAERNENNGKLLKSLENHYESLGKSLSAHRAKMNEKEDLLDANLEKMQNKMKELKSRKRENGLPISYENQQTFEEFLRASMKAVDEVSSSTSCFYDLYDYPDLSDNVVTSMVNEKESSKEIKEKINTVESTLNNVEEIVRNNENGISTDESELE